MDKAGFTVQLSEALQSLGVAPTEALNEGLWLFQEELLRWNSKVNLTAITQPAEVVEKHFADSLAVLEEVRGAVSVLDLGAGAGFPGIPLALALPELSVTLVDAVAKKVAFMRQMLVSLRLTPRCRAVHVRGQGKPAAEGIAQAEVVISRALMDVPQWLPFARPYLVPGGRVVAMMGKTPPDLAERAEAAGFVLSSSRTYELPISRAERCVAIFSPRS